MTRSRTRARDREGTRPHLDRRLDREARRQALLDAAVVTIRREGASASMESIAAEGGVTKPILYRHFGDRDGLVRAVAEHFATALFQELRGALGRSSEPRELLSATIDAYLAFVERDPDIYRFLVSQVAGAHAPDPDELSGFVRRIAAEITLVIGEQLRARGLDSGPAEPWAYGLVGMVQLAGDWWLERRTMPRQRLVDYLTTLLWEGLGAMTRAGRPPAGPTAG